MNKLTQQKNKKGFTLVELIIVVAVMAILVAVAIPTVISVVDSAKEATYNTNAATVESAIKTAIADNEGEDLDADGLDEALEDAKLGVDELFIYDQTTGKVLSYDQVEITEDDDGDTIEVAEDVELGEDDVLFTITVTKEAGAEGFVTVEDAE